MCRCVAAKGDDAPECDKFAKYYRALCPGEWVCISMMTIFYYILGTRICLSNKIYLQIYCLANVKFYLLIVSLDSYMEWNCIICFVGSNIILMNNLHLVSYNLVFRLFLTFCSI